MNALQLIQKNPLEAYYSLVTSKELFAKFQELKNPASSSEVYSSVENVERTKKALYEMDAMGFFKAVK